MAARYRCKFLDWWNVVSAMVLLHLPLKIIPVTENLLMQTGLELSFFGYMVLALLLITGYIQHVLRCLDVRGSFNNTQVWKAYDYQIGAFPFNNYYKLGSQCAGKKKIVKRRRKMRFKILQDGAEEYYS